MKSHVPRDRFARRCRGQTYLFMVVFLAVFLAGVIGLSTDYTQIWAHRQMAQAAADASCQAGAADLYLNYANASATTAYGLDYSWIGSPYNCSTHTASSPCRYASLNGYTGSGVAVEFPSSVPGAPSLAGYTGITYPYIRVTITDPVPLSFTKILSSTGTINVSARASCGMVMVSSPIPLLILDTQSSGALDRNGGGSIEIIGGPTRSIQVNSSSPTAVTPAGGSGLIDLRLAGPDGTGADFGVFGNESPLSYVLTGTGKWVTPALPWTDPWATKVPPSVPSTLGYATYVTFGTNGCPDPVGCVEFSPGNYAGTGANACKSSGTLGTGGVGCLIVKTPYRFDVPSYNKNATSYNAGAIVFPNAHNSCNCIYQAQNSGSPAGVAPNPWNQTLGGITVTNDITWVNIGSGFENRPKTAIFDPGVYYVGVEGLQLGPNSTVRQSTAVGDGSLGTTFYFSHDAGSGQNTGTINVGGGTGNEPGCIAPSTSNCVVSYKPDGSTQTFGPVTVASAPMQCPGGDPLPSLVPTTVDGNILMGPCTGTYKGSDDGTQRGFLFFQNRATSVSARWSGGGEFILSGFMYFHNEPNFTTTLEMAGNPSGDALTLGNIVTDKVEISGSSTIKMILNPNVTSPVLRPQLLR